MYTPSPRSHTATRGSPFHKPIPEGPILTFAKVIEHTLPEEWQKRTEALITLVAAIPSGDDYHTPDEKWFNSPTTLRHIAFPLSDLIKDARSTVVKKTCESCAELFAKCQTDARYLLKDVMPTILAVHAQTVAVIRSYVQDMILEALALVPCKMVMPLWLDRLKTDKSRTVREACALYLGTALYEWGNGSKYLSLEIWNQVATALGRALRDPAPHVRHYGKKGLETVYASYPDIIDRLASEREHQRDSRVKKTLQRILNGETVGDDMSVGSRSMASRTSNRGSGSVTGRPRARPPSRSQSSHASSTPSKGIPKTIGVESPSYMTTTNSSSTRNHHRQTVMGSGLGPPVRMTPFSAATSDSPSPLPPSNNHPRHSTNRSSGTPRPVTSTPSALSNSFDTLESNDSENQPFMPNNAAELRTMAKQKTVTSRRSSLLQERFSTKQRITTSASALSPDTTSRHTGRSGPIPEHCKIAEGVLQVHKKHVDQVMETLKVEMEVLKDFESLLLKKGPTEDDVLEYFESVGLCLDQRIKSIGILQKKMDKIASNKM